MKRMKRMMAAAAFTVTLGACGVSTQQEVELGQQYSQQINAQLPIVRDPEINRYINVLGDSIARVADSRNLDWSFYVVDSKEVNAFAVPGGFIYINRGLIERATDMSQVAGVLAHEIGHVTQRHSVQQMQKAQGRTSASRWRVCSRGCARARRPARRSTSRAGRSSPASAARTRRRPIRWGCGT